MNRVGDRFGTKNSNARDLINALGARTLASQELEWQTKRSSVRPRNFKNALILEGTQRLRRDGVDHELSFRFEEI